MIKLLLKLKLIFHSPKIISNMKIVDTFFMTTVIVEFPTFVVMFL